MGIIFAVGGVGRSYKEKKAWLPYRVSIGLCTLTSLTLVAGAGTVLL